MILGIDPQIKRVIIPAINFGVIVHGSDDFFLDQMNRSFAYDELAEFTQRLNSDHIVLNFFFIDQTSTAENSEKLRIWYSKIDSALKALATKAIARFLPFEDVFMKDPNPNPNPNLSPNPIDPSPIMDPTPISAPKWVLSPNGIKELTQFLSLCGRTIRFDACGQTEFVTRDYPRDGKVRVKYRIFSRSGRMIDSSGVIVLEPLQRTVPVQVPNPHPQLQALITIKPLPYPEPYY
jgi:hypothetical protein